MAASHSIAIGARFGKWTVKRIGAATIAGRQRQACHCVCDCGTERAILPSALQRGQSTQCRICSNRIQAAKKSRFTHGGTETRLYRIWCQMRRRCGSPAHEDYHRYGGRGISVCSGWGEFSAFRDWAEANGYQHNLTIDRRDNDGDYEPGNCRWVNRTVQNRNRGNNQRFEFRGEHLMLSEIAERCGISHDLLRIRVKRDGFDIERAVSQPKRGHPDHPTHRR